MADSEKRKNGNDKNQLSQISQSSGTSTSNQPLNYLLDGQDTPKSRKFPEVVEFWDLTGRIFAVPFERSKSREGLKAFILQIGLPDGIKNADAVVYDIRHDRFDFVDHENRVILVQAWEYLVIPGSIVKIKLHNALKQRILRNNSDEGEGRSKVDMIEEEFDQHANISGSSGSSSSTETSVNDNESFEGQLQDDVLEASDMAPPIKIASDEQVQREDEESIQAWKNTIPKTTDLNKLARWSHSTGHVDANMAKVLTLYALLGSAPNYTASYVMRMGVRIAKKGNQMSGKTAINVLIAVLRALSASETAISEKEILVEIYRRNACDLPFSLNGNLDDWLNATMESPHMQAFDAMNIWTRREYGKGYFKNLSKLKLNPARSSETSFRTDDLNIYSLIESGKLEIRWTDRLEDHLRLSMGGSIDDDVSFDFTESEDSASPHFSKPTVEIFWFDFEQYAWLARHFLQCEESEATNLAREVRRTWAFLFYPNQKRQRSKVRKVYNELPIPEWARSTFINRTHEKATPNHQVVDSPINNDAQEFQFHRQNSNMFRYNKSKLAGFEYQLFPYFGGRVEQLRAYMDSRKPKTLLDLARVKDPITFYTVVVALILGVVSIILTFLSFVVAVVQTWASVKALHSTSS